MYNICIVNYYYFIALSDEIPTSTTPEQPTDTTTTVTYEVPSTTSPSPPVDTTTSKIIISIEPIH